MGLTVQESVQKASIAVRENRLSEAIHDLQKVLAEAPDNFAAHHLLGVALMKAGRLSESIAQLLKATQLKPDHAAARTHLGMAYVAAGKTELAHKSYEAALKIDSAFAMAQTGLEKLPPLVATAKKVPPKANATDAPMPVPPVKTPTTPKVRDFTAPGAIQAKAAKKESIFSGVDSSDMALLVIGAVLLGAGVYVSLYFSIRVGIVLILLGISALKAGQPGREHWKDDF